jgi:UDP-N-acetylmuramyl-tripeptide synthetase
VYKEDEYLAFRVRQNNKNIITCGIDSVEDVCAYNINLSLQRIFFDLKIINSTFRSVSSGIFGKMHLKNLLVAISLAKISGIPDDLIVNAIEGLKNLEGRSEYVGSLNGCSIYVDYAHTADGLRNLLKEFREVCDGRLLLVFGCGGDRDRWKRAEMGECASEMADIVIVTDDNPRSEDPWQIRREILARCSKGLEIPDRGEAISHSMSLAKSGDVLLVCGKGHEKVQIYGDKIVNFNDKDVISRLIKKHTDQ